MADDPWAAFSPQSPDTPTPLIPRTPAPQTSAQAAKDQADADKARADATISQHKASEEGDTEKKLALRNADGSDAIDALVNGIHRARSFINDANIPIIGGNTATGVGYGIAHRIGGTDAAKLEGVINQEIRGNIFLKRISDLKAESDSGGSTGLARILQTEIPLMTGALGTLDPYKLGHDETLNSLDQIERAALRSKARLNGENPDDPAVQKKYNIPGLPQIQGGDSPNAPNHDTTPPAVNPGGSTPPAGPDGGGTPPSGPGGDKLAALNDQMHQMFRSGASTADIVAFGRAHGVDPNSDQIDAARKKGWDVSFVQPTQQSDQAPSPSGGGDKVSGLTLSDLVAGRTAPQDTSIGGQLLSGTKNDVAGIAQGAAALPDMAAKAAGKVMSVVPTGIGYGLDALGYGDSGSYMHDVARSLANPFQIGDAVESAAPTPNTTAGKVSRFAGQMVGGAVGFPGSAAENAVAHFVGEVPKAPLSAAQKVASGIVQDAKTAKVPLMTSDVSPPRTFLGRTAQAIGERIPITGTGSTRAAQQAARIDAVKSAAQEFGAATGEELNSPAIDGVAQDLAKRRSAELTRLTTQKNAVIDGVQGAVPTPNAIQAIDTQISRLSGINKDAFAPVVAKLQNFRDQLASGKTLSQIEGNRKLLGDMFADPSLAAIRGDGEKALSAIYGPLREDMGSFIKANGNPGDFNRWKSANDALAGMVGDLKNSALKKALGTADMTPENVGNLLFSQKPSDVRTLYAGLSPAGRAKAQAAIIQRAVEKSGGMDGLSPEKFATQINSLGKSVGVFFQDADRARIEGLARVLKITQRASQAALSPPTGVQAMPYVMGAGFTEAFGIPGGLSAAMGTGLLARAYESAPVRNLLLKLGQSKEGTQEERFLMRRVGAAITASMQSHSAAPTALNENIPQMGAAVASPDQRPNQQQ